MKQGTTEKVKFKKLKRRLRLPEWQCIGLLESIWRLTATSAPAGDIGKLSNEDIAASIEYDGDADTLVADLVDCGWLDQCQEHRLIVHDWADHAPNFVKGHIKKHNREFASKSTKQLETVPNSSTKHTETVPDLATKQGDKSSYDPATKPSLVQPSPAQSNQTKPNQTKPYSDCNLETASPPEATPRVSVQEFFDRWNRFAKKTPKLAECRKLTDKRRKQIAIRLKTAGWFEDFAEAVITLPLGGDGWQPTLDYLIKNEHNIYLLLEGNFDWRSRDDPASQRLAEQRRKSAYEQRQREESCRREQSKLAANGRRSDIESILNQSTGKRSEMQGASLLFGEDDFSAASGADSSRDSTSLAS